MRVMFLQPQPCIRALKIARGLKEASGEKISIVLGFLEKTLTELYGYGDEYFDEVVRLDPEDLGGSVSDLADNFDPHIIHSHNAPDYLTVSALKAFEGAPVIHDIHDSLTMRSTGYYEGDDAAKIQGYAVDEKFACEESDGRIYVNEMIRDYLHRRYSLDPDSELVLYNYVSEALIPVKLGTRLSSRDGEIHIAYAGTITSKIDGSHYDLRFIFREIARHGFHIHIFASREDDGYRLLADESPFIHYHGHLDQRKLLQELTKYDFGWAGFNDARNKVHLDVVLPNKAFEYIACGLPIITFPHKALSEFVQEQRVGLVVEDFDIRERLENAHALHENVYRKRYDFTIEKNIDSLVEFYRDIMRAQGRKIQTR